MATFPLTLRKHLRIRGTLTCRTGLRIGGTAQELEIGGMDLPVIRDFVTRLPYVPGSSIKGKLRSSLEYKLGLEPGQRGAPHGCRSRDCLLCTVFGPHAVQEHELGPTRIIVRDALLSAESLPVLKRTFGEGLPSLEAKTETWIDRRTGVAGQRGLRTTERVPAGTKFDLEIVLRIFAGDDEKAIVDFVRQGLDSLEKEYLGGSGTRGYGWVTVDYEVSDA